METTDCKESLNLSRGQRRIGMVENKKGLVNMSKRRVVDFELRHRSQIIRSKFFYVVVDGYLETRAVTYKTRNPRWLFITCTSSRLHP